MVNMEELYRLIEEKIKAAYELAKNAHGEQKRISGKPYITHPLAVADIVADMKLDCDSICAALLHDVVEDTSYSREDIKNKATELANKVKELDVEEVKDNIETKMAADTNKKTLIDFYRDLPDGQEGTDLGLYYMSYLDDACKKVNVKFESLVNQFASSDLTVINLNFNF